MLKTASFQHRNAKGKLQSVMFNAVCFSIKGIGCENLRVLPGQFGTDSGNNGKNDFYEIKTVGCVMSIDGNDSCKRTEIESVC